MRYIVLERSLGNLIPLRGCTAVVTGGAAGMGRVLMFAASDLGAFVSGSVIPVDGGDLAR